MIVMNSRLLRALSDILVANLKLQMQYEWTVCVGYHAKCERLVIRLFAYVKDITLDIHDS